MTSLQLVLIVNTSLIPLVGGLLVYLHHGRYQEEPTAHE